MSTVWKGALIGLVATAALGAFARDGLAASCGDLNNNTQRQINDVVILLRSVNNLENDAALCGGLGVLQCGDINANGAKDIGDVVTLLRNVNNIETIFPICVGEGPTLAGCPGTAVLPKPIASNLVIPAGCDAQIDGVTFVEPGVVLTIKAGAVIKGRKGAASPSVLVVKRDGKLNAVGTAANPITFTSDQAPGTRTKGDHGGIAILGRAPVNQPGGEDSVEGLNPGEGVFGGNEVNDSSGVVRFTRVQFSGRELSLDNELNLFVMAGVGRGTTIDHVQGHLGLDDCIEWFGGTVNTKFMVASGCGDDGFDSQLGTRGGLQFGLIAQEIGTVEAGGSNGWESDNNESGFDNAPRTDQKYCNVTALGVRGQAGVAPATNQVGALARRGTAITIANSIIKDFADSGVQLRDTASAQRACLNAATLNTAAPVLGIQNTIFFNNGPTGTTTFKDHASAPAGAPCSTTEWGALLVAQRNVIVADPGLGAGNTFPPTPADYIPPAGSLAATHPAANCTAIDGSFQNAPYIGGFEPGGADWTAGWTEYPLN